MIAQRVLGLPSTAPVRVAVDRRMSAEGYYRDARDLDAVLIVDGTYLQRPELAAFWDAVIYVRTSPEVCLQRGIDRDSARLGGPEQTRRMYAQRYQPAYEIYEQEASPEASADVIIDNDNPAHPIVNIQLDRRI